MKTMQRVMASMMLIAGLGLWASASAAPAAEAREAQEPAADPVPAACWECVKNTDCDAKCGAAGAGYCQWNGCTRCLCTM